jgi:hypothetical protein
MEDIKNKSEELAKLLKIQPRFKVVIEGMKRPRSSWFMTGETFESKEEALEYISTIITPYKKAYPIECKVNFTEPNNFVKPYEIPIQDLGNGIIRTLGKLVKPANNRSDFIGNIFKRAEDDNSLGGDFWKIASEFAQQVEWRY